MVFVEGKKESGLDFLVVEVGELGVVGDVVGARHFAEVASFTMVFPSI